MKQLSKIFLILFYLCIHSSLLGQNLEWAYRVGLSLDEAGKAIAVDQSGNVYTTGYFSGIVDFDPSAGVYNLTSSGLLDIFIQKVNAAGNLIWAKNVGSPNDDEGFAIVVDSLENVYVTGYFQGQADFDPNQGVENRISQGMRDIFVLKLDSLGNLVWVNTMGSSDDDVATDLVLDTNDNLCIVGTFSDFIDFDPSASTFYVSETNGAVFIQKLDSNGNLIWVKNFSRGSLSYEISIDLDRLGNIYTNGVYWETSDFNPDTTASYLLPHTGTGLDIFVQKLDPFGNFIWAKGFGSNFSDFAYDIGVDINGNVYSVGSYSDTVDFDPNSGINYLVSEGGTDIFIQKLDSSGNFIWAKSMGGTTSDYGFSLAIDKLQNVYISGAYSGTVDFNPNSGTMNLTALGATDIFLQKLDVNGELIWVTSMGGNSDEFPHMMIIDSVGGIYLTGFFTSTANFNPNSGIYNLTSQGSFDAFVVKLDEDISSGLLKYSKSKLKLYPNPTNGNVTITSENSSSISLYVYDIKGKEIYSKQNIRTPSYQLDLSSAISGVYFIEVHEKNAIQIFKLVLVK